MNEWFPTFKKIPQTPFRDLLRWQFSGRLNWRAAVAESDLPDQAQEKIVSVVKATRLWRIEKAQIANELIAHFQDGQQRGQGVDELVAEFGETETVAKLMRSAKKRNRSIFWNTFVAGCYAFLGFLVFYAGLAIWFFSGEPKPSIDYLQLINEWSRSVAPENQAWPIYRKAWIEHDFAEVCSQRIFHQRTESGERMLINPDDPEWDRVIEFLDKRTSLVEAFRQGGQRSGLGLEIKHYRDYSDADMQALVSRKAWALEDRSWRTESYVEDEQLRDCTRSILLPHTWNIRCMSWALRADALRAAEAGDSNRVIRNLEAMLGFGPQAAESPIIVCALVGLATERIAYHSIEKVLTDYPALLSNAQLEAIQQRVRSNSIRSFFSIAGERALEKDIVQRVYSDDGNGGGRMTNEGWNALQALAPITSLLDEKQSEPSLLEQARPLAGPASLLLMASRKEVEQAIDAEWDQIEDRLNYSIREKPLLNDDDDFSEKYDNLRYQVVAYSFPNINQIRTAVDATLAMQESVLAGIAIRQFDLVNDRLPISLDELVPEFLEAVPIDIVSGEKLKYRIMDDLPLIYSVGADLDDDGGVEAVDPLGRTMQDMNLDESRHLDSANNLYQLDGDWILWPAASR